MLIFQINHTEKQCTFSSNITVLKIYSDIVGNQPAHYTENQNHYSVGVFISWTHSSLLQVLFQPHFTGLPLKHFGYFPKSNPSNYDISLLILSKIIFYKSEANMTENLCPINPDSSPHYLRFRFLLFQLPVAHRTPKADEPLPGESSLGQLQPRTVSFTSCHLLTKAFYHLTSSQEGGVQATIFEGVRREGAHGSERDRPPSHNFYYILYNVVSPSIRWGTPGAGQRWGGSQWHWRWKISPEAEQRR